MSTSTADHEGTEDNVPVTPEPVGRRARTVSQILISSALGNALVAALAGSAQPRAGASFFADGVADATPVSCSRRTMTP